MTGNELYLGTYSFEGVPDILISAYERFMAGIPAEHLPLHLCTVSDRGLTIIDACPSREAFESFTGSSQFHDAVGAAGLPQPRVAALGHLRVAHVQQEVTA